MAGLNGTGPMGEGPMTGRGLGYCNDNNKETLGFGRGLGRGLFSRGGGRGRGCGRGYVNYQNVPNPQANDLEILRKQKDFLDKRIEELEKSIVK
ncbi:MAG TPA: DUF5320 domain-containing protein [Spirochaetota bacterium]|nr:DUF5320 domain-containing protein [Spirochaetota bacterium]